MHVVIDFSAIVYEAAQVIKQALINIESINKHGSQILINDLHSLVYELLFHSS